MRPASLIVLAVVLAVTGSPFALAAPPESVDIDESARRASHLARIEGLRKDLAEAAEHGPLVFRRVLLVTSPPVRFGEYSVREKRSFASGEAIHIYVEPVGLVWKMLEDGNFALECSVDLSIETSDRVAIVKEVNFGRIRVRNRERISEVMTHLTLTLSDAPPGEFVAVVTYRDVHSGKQAMFRLPFEVALRPDER